MKSAISFILSALVILISFQKSIFLIDYQVNRDVYEAMCENKARPELQCFGQCKLMEKMEKKESETRFVNFILEVNMLPVNSIEIPTFKAVPSKEENAAFSVYSANLSQGFLSRLLNPPRIQAFA